MPKRLRTLVLAGDMGRNFVDGADVVDCLTEIPLPGRLASAQCAAPRAEDAPNSVLPSFVAGPENRLVAATLGRLLEATQTQPAATACGTPTYCPALLALFGQSGTGKTHLAHGLVRFCHQQRGAESALYVTANDFRRQFAKAIEQKTVAEFREQFRERQLLAIDDLHQLPASEHFWPELRATLDGCEERGATVLITSQRPPSTLGNLPPDLRGRLAAGLTLQLNAPGSAARLRIVRQASAALGLAVPDDGARRLACRVSGTAADLLGALFALGTPSQTGGPSDNNQTERLLAHRDSRKPTLSEVLALVAKHQGVPQKQLKSGSRKQSTVFARAIAVYLARELSAASYDQIGRALGGRDHTTIMHSYRKIDR